MTPGLHPLVNGLPEPWAVEWGEDRFGVFQGFAVSGVVQRMRWVPLGRFMMGSPKGEAGRNDDEGPQHEVELTRGFWLADTPCTQALWQAVMGENPSDFVSPDRPVERVSWNDCQAFLTRLNEVLGDFGARLPSEAEWEYACRAGTETATWLGDLEILGANNAPLLDAIAWYGGNSGDKFDLRNGFDSSAWPSKQHPHTRAGTRRVRLKPPNPLGLFDMLGNVYEWCEDSFGTYAGTSEVDPTEPSTGSSRVLRGGSWFSFARSVRAAYRLAILPEYRGSDLGFRLALGHAPASGAEPGPRSGPRNRAEGRGPVPAPVRDATAPRRR